MNEKKHIFSLWRIYLLIATFVGLIGFIVGYGTVMYTAIERVMISDQEYINIDRYYELEQCEYAKHDGSRAAEEDIVICEQEKTEKLIIQRSGTIKKSLIRGGVRGTIFMILFLLYYPKFKKLNQEE